MSGFFRWIFATVLVASVLVSACAPAKWPPCKPCQRSYAVSADFDSVERASIEIANERWNAFGKERWCLVTGDGFEHTIRRVYTGTPEADYLERLAGASPLYGAATASDDRIALFDKMDPKLLEIVAMHELGHRRGLEHVKPPGIMQPHATTDLTSFTDNDKAECLRVGACGEVVTYGQERCVE